MNTEHMGSEYKKVYIEGRKVMKARIKETMKVVVYPSIVAMIFHKVHDTTIRHFVDEAIARNLNHS